MADSATADYLGSRASTAASTTNAVPQGDSVAYLVSAGIFSAGAILAAALRRSGMPDEIESGAKPVAV